MGKITKFNTNPEHYYNLAIDKAENGEYLVALEYLSRAERLAYATDKYNLACVDFLNFIQSARFGPSDGIVMGIRFERSEIYARLGFFDDANKELFKIASDEFSHDEIFYCLIKNFILMDMTKEAAYYLNLGLDKGVLDELDGFGPIDIEEVAKQNTLRLVGPTGAEHSLNAAKQLALSGENKMAKKILLDIKEGTKEYSDALRGLIRISFDEKKYDEGMEFIEKALEKNDKDADVLLTKVLGYELLEKKEEAQKLLEEIDKLNFDDIDAYAKLATRSAVRDDARRVKLFSEKVLKEVEFDKEMLVLNALANHNLGNKAQAKNAIVKACTVFPNDYNIFFFAKIIDSEEHVKISMSTELPLSLQKSLIKSVEDALKTIKDEGEFIEMMIENDKFRNAVFWGFFNSNSNLQHYLADYLSNHGTIGYTMVTDFLIDTTKPISLKKTIFLNILKRGVVQFINVVNNHQFTSFYVKPPKFTQDKTMLDAYHTVFASLAFIQQGFEKKLKATFKKVVEATTIESKKKKPKVHLNAIAAVIAHTSRLNKIFFDINGCLEIFGCSMEDFMLYHNQMTKSVEIKKLSRKKAL
ncbi:MAG: hypothetical protein FWC11_00850 [Firmicutes bacterium]|nr:hypothetical protein [Bacillota bacterium]MCL2255390.1 hypothetical protein [Bacillota bacterium]